MLLLLFVRFLAGSWLSLKSVQCSNSSGSRISNTYLCYNTSSEITCFTTFFTSHRLPVRMPFENASDWCKGKVPGSSLVVVKSEQDQTNLKLFIGRQALQNETIIMDARKLSTSESRNWSWVNGHQIIPKVATDPASAVALHIQQNSPAYVVYNVSSSYRYMCEFSDSKRADSYKQNNKSYAASNKTATWYDARKECLRLGGDLASITDLQTIRNWSWLNTNYGYWIGLHRNKWIWNCTGAALTYSNWEGGYPDETSNSQCICINPQRRRENNRTICDHERKWRTCNCNLNYAVVCQEQNKSVVVTKKIVPAKPMQLSTSTTRRTSAFRSTPPAIATTTSTKTPIATTPVKTTTSTKTPIAAIPTTTTSSTKTPIATTRTTATTIAIIPPFKPIISRVTTYTTNITDGAAGEIDRKAASFSSMTQNPPSNHFAENETTAFASSSTGLFKSFNTTEILLIVLLLVAVAFIVVVVILVIRRRKYDRRNEGSPTRNTKQSETVTSVYATVVKVNRPSRGTAPSGNTIYTDVEMIQRSTSSNSSIYANVQPNFEADDMGESVDYMNLDSLKQDQQKPSSADKITTCFSPIYSQPCKLPTSASGKVYADPNKPGKRSTATASVPNHNAAGDQQNIYPLAEAIPLGDPNAIYSQPNKPTKSSNPTCRPAMDTGPIYLDAIEVKHGAGNGDAATQDPNALYAEPMKLKKSSFV